MEFEDIEDGILNDLINNATQPDHDIPENTPPPPSRQNPGPEHLEVLSKYFGHKTFRPMQWQIISAIIDNSRDVCAVMSTGYGKSLCYQFPSTFLGGVTLVISPLIALMEDQVLALEVANIPACLLGSAQKRQGEVIDEIFKNKYSLVYLTPEFCMGDYGSSMLNKMCKELSVVLIAIDEAHCISSWGHDFRVQYRQLGMLREIFPTVPIIAVTATATPRVRADIVKNLKLSNPLNICSGFDRPNIYFEVNFKMCGGDVFRDLSKAMLLEGSSWKFAGPTIVYCITRKETEEIAQTLKGLGLKCLPYHAGLSLSDRTQAHELFVKDKIDVIIATIAFGMGIDKPDIRNVVHYGCSKSIESYYQEVGRAGRDGLPAKCVTFYSQVDFVIQRRLNSLSAGNKEQKEESLKRIEEYLITRKCRRCYILEYFEDNIDHLNQQSTTCCDNCTKKVNDSRTDFEKYEGIDENGCFDFTNYARKFLKVVSLFYGNSTLTTYNLFLRGSHSVKLEENKKKHPLHGCGKDKPEAFWQAIAKILVQEKYLNETCRKTLKGFSYTSIGLTHKGEFMLIGTEKMLLPPPSTILNYLKKKQSKVPAPLQPTASQPSTSTSIVQLMNETETEAQARMTIYKKLFNQRKAFALELDCSPYMVASDAALMAMARYKPKTIDDLRRLNLDGFAEAKINKFGDKFLKVITEDLDVEPEVKQQSIKDILATHPLPEISISLTSQVSCTMFDSGLTVGEIAEKRGVLPSTIMSHLVSGIKFGYPIKMIEMGVSEECRDTVIKNYRKFCKNGFSSVKLKLLKEDCPPEITYDQISTVLAYFQVRCHLQFLDIPYEEFEDFQFGDVEVDEVQDENSDDAFKDDFDIIVTQRWDEICKANEDVKSGDHIGSPAKKMKIDFDSILDSPPRQHGGQSSHVPAETQLNEISSSVQAVSDSQEVQSNPRKGKKKALPPWLIVKKIN